jgi:hypothetical protein
MNESYGRLDQTLSPSSHRDPFRVISFLINVRLSKSNQIYCLGLLFPRCDAVSPMLALFLALSASQCDRVISTSTENVTINDTTFDGCSASSDGGAVYLYSPSVHANITACTFLNCSSRGDGGAIYFSGSRLSVVRSSTFLCRATAAGASLYTDYPSTASVQVLHWSCIQRWGVDRRLFACGRSLLLSC